MPRIASLKLLTSCWQRNSQASLRKSTKKSSPPTMPDEIQPRIDNLGELAGKGLNHVVAAPVAEGIVEGLEIVDVDVGRHKAVPAASSASVRSLIGTLPGSCVSGLA